MFYIQITDTDGGVYILDAYVETKGLYKEIYIGDTHKGSRTNTCIKILLKKGNNEALLEDFNTRISCDINHSLTEGSGTRRLLMGALKYLITSYKHIKIVHLSDLAQKKGTRIYLTPRRLLLGKPGWYEEYFGAKLVFTTELVIQSVLSKITLTAEDVSNISQKTWGTYKDINKLSDEAHKLIHTDWVITSEVIESYPVEIKVFNNLKNGGGIKDTNALIEKCKQMSSQYCLDKVKAIQRRYSKK